MPLSSPVQSSSPLKLTAHRRTQCVSTNIKSAACSCRRQAVARQQQRHAWLHVVHGFVRGWQRRKRQKDVHQHSCQQRCLRPQHQQKPCCQVAGEPCPPAVGASSTVELCTNSGLWLTDDFGLSGLQIEGLDRLVKTLDCVQACQAIVSQKNTSAEASQEHGVHRTWGCLNMLLAHQSAVGHLQREVPAEMGIAFTMSKSPATTTRAWHLDTMREHGTYISM
jgi:hypothetical protein